MEPPVFSTLLPRTVETTFINIPLTSTVATAIICILPPTPTRIQIATTFINTPSPATITTTLSWIVEPPVIVLNVV